MAPRKKHALNFGNDSRNLLFAFGDVRDPLEETCRVLDELMTDYITSTCLSAAAYASHGRRTKVKVDDFNFVLRRDPAKLGRVSNLLSTQAYQAKMRKQFNEFDDSLAGGAAAAATKELERLAEEADGGAEGKEGGGGGKIRGGRVEKKRKEKGRGNGKGKGGHKRTLS